LPLIVVLTFISLLLFSFKLAFLVWCFLPQTRGAQWVYIHVLRDLLNKGESTVEKASAAIHRVTEGSSSKAD
jgi:hypothetical protein